MEKSERYCQFFTETAGCSNPEEAGKNAGETPIRNQQWSCNLSQKPGLMITCPGFMPQKPLPENKGSNITEEMIKNCMTEKGLVD